MIFERRDSTAEPFFSICIPQYNRTSFLIAVLKSLDQQVFRDFEVCISDDCSTDGRQAEIGRFLANSKLAYIYRERVRNGRYDANLRTSISLARGRFCFLLGNDDALADELALEAYARELSASDTVGVATSNFADARTGSITRRVRGTRVLPGTPETAVRMYRNFSFVGGVVVRRDRAQFHATERWDGAEMYQTYLATRMIAEGCAVLCFDRLVVRSSVQVPGETIDSVFARPRLNPCPIVERRLTLTDMGRLVADALPTITPPAAWERQVEWAVIQLYLFPYVYWLFTYRRIQSWNYAAGICLGMRPRNVLAGIRLSTGRQLRVAFAYSLASLCGLLAPVALFEKSKAPLLGIAKAFTSAR